MAVRDKGLIVSLKTNVISIFKNKLFLSLNEMGFWLVKNTLRCLFHFARQALM